MLTRLLILLSFLHLQWLYRLAHQGHKLENIVHLQDCMLYLTFVPVMKIQIFIHIHHQEGPVGFKTYDFMRKK